MKMLNKKFNSISTTSIFSDCLIYIITSVFGLALHAFIYMVFFSLLLCLLIGIVLFGCEKVRIINNSFFYIHFHVSYDYIYAHSSVAFLLYSSSNRWYCNIFGFCCAFLLSLCALISTVFDPGVNRIWLN